LPRFREVPLESMYLNPGERVFEWRHSEALRLFLLLVPDLKGGERFTVELGWSARGRFPELGMRPSMRPPRRAAELEEEEYICRLGELCKGGDYWWRLGAPPALSVAGTVATLQAQIAPMGMAEAREIVQPVVADAVTQLKRHGVPYLEDWLESRGVDDPTR
jgi:hypothetical protein